MSDKEHIQKHLSQGTVIDLVNASQKELGFYYFHLHDKDADRQLDGLELVAAMRHGYDHQMEQLGHDVQFPCAIDHPLLAHHWRVHPCLLTSRFIAPSIPLGDVGPCCEQTHAAFQVGLSLDQGQGVYSGWSDVDSSSQLRLCHTCIIDFMEEKREIWKKSSDKILRNIEHAVDMVLNETDTDQDGYLTYTEFSKSRKAHGILTSVSKHLTDGTPDRLSQ